MPERAPVIGAQVELADSLREKMPSRESLVGAFTRALERRDSTALRQLVLSRAEIAYLYYPTAPQGLPPYDMNADLMWLMLSLQSEKGMHRALSERGGRPLHVAAVRCNEKPDSQGATERGGSCKFFTYANKL
jgi:hypothetical protein